ncbi:MAG: hypothetical protein ABIG61_11300 [Planctomycetota bacterium]
MGKLNKSDKEIGDAQGKTLEKIGNLHSLGKSWRIFSGNGANGVG